MPVHEPGRFVLELPVDEYPETEDAPEGVEGEGRFRFRVVRDVTAGTATIELLDVQLQMPNRADKALSELTAEEANETESEDTTDEVDVY